MAMLASGHEGIWVKATKRSGSVEKPVGGTSKYEFSFFMSN
jgi:hypothetical protein